MASRKDNKGRVLKTGESQRKDGTYQYRYTDLLGHRKYEYAKTLNQLRQREEEIQKSQVEGINQSGGKMTLSELFDVFLKIKINQVKESTYETYTHIRDLVNKYPISRLSIENIRTTMLAEWLYSLQKDGYSQGTVRMIKHLLHGVFDIALMDDYIRKNPCMFRLYFKEKVHTQKYALTFSQQKALLEFTKTHKRFSSYYNMVVVLMGTGMRISELLGITIKDIDFQQNCIHVNRQLSKKAKGTFVLTTPKSANGLRSIPLMLDVKESLKDQISKRNLKQEVIIDGHYGFLFINNSTGLPYTKAAVRYALVELINDYNENHKDQLPHLSPHIFRHTFASMMIQSGMDAKTLQHLLGHANVATTLDTYTHLFDNHIACSISSAEEYIAANR